MALDLLCQLEISISKMVTFFFSFDFHLFLYRAEKRTKKLSNTLVKGRISE